MRAIDTTGSLEMKIHSDCPTLIWGQSSKSDLVGNTSGASAGPCQVSEDESAKRVHITKEILEQIQDVMEIALQRLDIIEIWTIQEGMHARNEQPNEFTPLNQDYEDVQFFHYHAKRIYPCFITRRYSFEGERSEFSVNWRQANFLYWWFCRTGKIERYEVVSEIISAIVKEKKHLNAFISPTFACAYTAWLGVHEFKGHDISPAQGIHVSHARLHLGMEVLCHPL